MIAQSRYSESLLGWRYNPDLPGSIQTYHDPTLARAMLDVIAPELARVRRGLRAERTVRIEPRYDAWTVKGYVPSALSSAPELRFTFMPIPIPYGDETIEPWTASSRKKLSSQCRRPIFTRPSEPINSIAFEY